MNQLNNAANYIDASNYPDMQELLYAADVLITDYSSSMWDFSLTRRPCFLYATDLNYYDLDRGFYSDIHTWPYPLAESNSALIKNIKQFNNDQYQKISKSTGMRSAAMNPDMPVRPSQIIF